MTSNKQKLGTFVSEAMERLDEENSNLGAIMIVCELQITDQEGDEATLVRYSCNDDRAHVALGLLRMAQLAAETNR